jgi:predicted dehydrogenase
MEKKTLSVVIVGFGRMGKRHAAAYQELDEFDLVAICGRGHQRDYAEANFPSATFYLDAQTAIVEAKADVVCISTHVDSHESLARAAIANGAHVFLEKPVAQTLEESEALFSYANGEGKKIVVGYVRKHDPLWKAFVSKGRQLGSPVVVRFLMDQPSAGDEWHVHQSILKDSSLTFDCAVHYVDMMAKICGKNPVSVMGRSVRLHGDPSKHGNYGYLSVEFSDGSVGSFDSAWGPMVGGKPSPVITATGPAGSVSIVSTPDKSEDEKSSAEALVYEPTMTSEEDTRDIEVIQCADLTAADGEDSFTLQQRYLYDCIVEDVCMNEHYNDVIISMLVVAAADESVATGELIRLPDTKPRFGPEDKA